jgi:hypothetical protein
MSSTLETVVSPSLMTHPGLLRGLGNRWVKRAAALGVFLFGLFLTLSFWAEPGSPVVFDDGVMIASGRLQGVLEDPALGEHRGATVITETFKDKDGRQCRRFSEGLVTGVACRVGDGWRMIELRQP